MGAIFVEAPREGTDVHPAVGVRRHHADAVASDTDDAGVLGDRIVPLGGGVDASFAPSSPRSRDSGAAALRASRRATRLAIDPPGVKQPSASAKPACVAM